MRRALFFGLVFVFPAVHAQAPQITVPPVQTPVLEHAGGAKREADYRNMFLLRADGSAISNRGGWSSSGQLASVTPQPGDSIVVPEELLRTTLTKNLKDWTQIFFQFGLGATALKVIGD